MRTKRKKRYIKVLISPWDIQSVPEKFLPSFRNVFFIHVRDFVPTAVRPWGKLIL